MRRRRPPTAGPATAAESGVMSRAGLAALTALALLLAACQTGGRGQPARTSASAGGDLASIQVNDDDSRLLGMTPGALLAELGEPPVKRRESPAEVWQYAGSGCVLDLFLYDQGAGQKVVHYEARDEAARTTDARPCFAELLRLKKAGLVG